MARRWRWTAPDDWGTPDGSNLGRFGFTGQAWVPELGMYYYKARIYSPTLGRFLQVDPIGYRDQQNLYAYVGNDPVDGRDPSGMFSCGESMRANACAIFMYAQNVATARLTAQIRVLTTLRERILSGGRLTMSQRAAVSGLNRYLGAGRGASSAAIGRLIDRAGQMQSRLNSRDPVEMGIVGDSGVRGISSRHMATAPLGYRPFLLNPVTFFGASLNDRAFALVHESVHVATNNTVRDWATTDVGGYGQANAIARAAIWPQRSFDSNADTTVYALGFRRDGDE